jgi:hypothetical protein
MPAAGSQSAVHFASRSISLSPHGRTSGTLMLTKTSASLRRVMLRAAVAGIVAVLVCSSARAQTGADAYGDYQSKNFLVTGTTVKIAKRIAERAEKCRVDLAKQWLGAELPDWPTPCRMEVSLTPGRIGGVSTFDFNAPAASWSPVRMCLSGDLEGILANCLPHEVTHTILADHFRRPVPRWADEGSSILEEGAEVRGRFDRMAHDLAVKWELYRLDYLFGLRDYPPRKDVLYSQGYSVAHFLVERKDRATFVAFLKVGVDGDWETACKKCYGFESLNEMQTAWLDTFQTTTAKK